TLRDAAGRALLELAADDVTASVLGSLDGGGEHVTTWHELEAELVEGDLRLLREVEARLLAAGARLSASPSKLARALGDRLDGRQDGQEIRQPGLGTAAAALQRYLRDQ